METKKRDVLQFAPFLSSVDEGFCHRLSSLKLKKLGIYDSPIPITGFYAPCSHSRVLNHLTLLADSLPSDSSEESSEQAVNRGNRNRCPVPGTLYNTNMVEGLMHLTKMSCCGQKLKRFGRTFRVEKLWRIVQYYPVPRRTNSWFSSQGNRLSELLTTPRNRFLKPRT